MHRLLLSILLALSLVGAPAAAAPVSAGDCTMTKMAGMPVKPSKESKMDCCTTGCLFAGAAAVLPNPVYEPASTTTAAGLGWPSAPARVRSITPSALDPPPRSLVP